MKHIKKRYAFESENLPKEFENKIQFLSETNYEIPSGSRVIFIETDEGIKARAFSYKPPNLNRIVIPIPDLTLVYFDSAYSLNKFRLEQQRILFKKLEITEDKLGEQAIHEVYRYYGYAASCIITLFTAIESFTNHLIPDNGIYIKKGTQKTEHYTKEQIQRYLPFDEKIKKVLPQLIQVTYRTTSPTYQHIDNLKKLRDEIVHTKSDEDFQKQEELIKKVLNFKYDITIDAVAKFINHYKPDFIVECQCGNDF